MLDYAFYKLGVQSDSVAHPVVMTEALCNPHYSRGCALLSRSEAELLARC